jgi:hypothetical protein
VEGKTKLFGRPWPIAHEIGAALHWARNLFPLDYYCHCFGYLLLLWLPFGPLPMCQCHRPNGQVPEDGPIPRGLHARSDEFLKGKFVKRK